MTAFPDLPLLSVSTVSVCCPPIFAVPEQKFCFLAQAGCCWASLGRSAFPISAPYLVPKMQFHEYEFINTNCPIPPPISFISFPSKILANQLGHTASGLQENAVFQRSKPSQPKRSVVLLWLLPDFPHCQNRIKKSILWPELEFAFSYTSSESSLIYFTRSTVSANLSLQCALRDCSDTCREPTAAIPKPQTPWELIQDLQILPAHFSSPSSSQHLFELWQLPQLYDPSHPGFLISLVHLLPATELHVRHLLPICTFPNQNSIFMITAGSWRYFYSHPRQFFSPEEKAR